ncbi:MAG: hypothetical protein AB7D03_06520 [Thiomicrospira sp.]
MKTVNAADIAPHLDLSDLDSLMIQHIADKFIAQYGMRRVSDGHLIASTSPDSIASALHELLRTPQHGLRQVVPMIKMISNALGLPFDDPLYELELKKMADKQRLANQIESLFQQHQRARIRLNLGDLLTQIDAHELAEAIPLIESQLNFPHRPLLTEDQILYRIGRLWRDYADSEIVLSLQLNPEQSAQHQVADLMQSVNDMNIEQQAEHWIAQHLHSTQHDNFNAFLRAFNQASPELQLEIEKRLHPSAPTSAPALTLHQDTPIYRFFTDWLKKILQAWIYHR